MLISSKRPESRPNSSNDRFKLSHSLFDLRASKYDRYMGT